MTKRNDSRSIRFAMERLIEDIQADFKHGECFYDETKMVCIQKKLYRVNELSNQYIELIKKEEE